MEQQQKDNFKKLIEENIKSSGYHVTIVNSPLEPRYAYTIGLREEFEFELAFAGGIFYLKNDVFNIFNAVVEVIKNSKEINGQKISVNNLGVFSIAKIDSSWSELMMLGVYDYFGTKSINAFQIIPESNLTLDVPDMSNHFNASDQPIWKWLTEKWEYNVPEVSTVTTDLDVLLGSAVTELTRWEIDEWEMFSGSGSEVDEKDIRVVSLATMLGMDNTLLPAISLEVEGGLWRESIDSEWNNWD